MSERTYTVTKIEIESLIDDIQNGDLHWTNHHEWGKGKLRREGAVAMLEYIMQTAREGWTK